MGAFLLEVGVVVVVGGSGGGSTGFRLHERSTEIIVVF